jgi:rhodanese-related sulfurtransferase
MNTQIFKRFAMVRGTVISGALVCFVALADATPQTVGDDACPRYAVDIAAFATCDGDRVTAPDKGNAIAMPIVLVDDYGNTLPPRIEAIPQDMGARTKLGNYLTAEDAYAAKYWLVRAVLFVDVRDEATANASGIPVYADFNLPLTRLAKNGTPEVDADFVVRAMQALASRGLALTAPVFVICENGRHAARAADVLAEAGIPNVFVVRGGIHGERSVNGKTFGWLASGLPMSLPVSRAF